MKANDFRFIISEHAPFGGGKGLLVHKTGYRREYTIFEMVNMLEQIGLKRYADYVIIGDGLHYGNEMKERFARVIFQTEESFVMAKMLI